MIHLVTAMPLFAMSTFLMARSPHWEVRYLLMEVVVEVRGRVVVIWTAMTRL